MGIKIAEERKLTTRIDLQFLTSRKSLKSVIKSRWNKYYTYDWDIGKVERLLKWIIENVDNDWMYEICTVCQSAQRYERFPRQYWIHNAWKKNNSKYQWKTRFLNILYFANACDIMKDYGNFHLPFLLKYKLRLLFFREVVLRLVLIGNFNWKADTIAIDDYIFHNSNKQPSF